MKKFCLALFLLVAISVTSANAQTPMSFSVQGGYSWSIGVLGAEAQFGNIGLAGGWMPSIMIRT